MIPPEKPLKKEASKASKKKDKSKVQRPADRREETTDLRFHPGGKAARRRAAIRAISACAVAIAYCLARSTSTRNFFTLTSATEWFAG